MTIGMMNPCALFEKTPGADLLREMIGFAAERLMELEIGTVTGASYGEKDGSVAKFCVSLRLSTGQRC